MPIPVRVSDVIKALQETTESNSHYLDKRTGDIIMLTDEDWSAAEDSSAADTDELISDYPDWQRDLILKAREIQESDHFVELPDKSPIRDYEIIHRFCRNYPNQKTSIALLGCIKGTGGFRRFNRAVVDLGIQEKWKQFEQSALRRIAIDWLEENSIPYTAPT
jgi:uncharacterized protein UPF0158